MRPEEAPGKAPGGPWGPPPQASPSSQPPARAGTRLCRGGSSGTLIKGVIDGDLLSTPSVRTPQVLSLCQRRLSGAKKGAGERAFPSQAGAWGDARRLLHAGPGRVTGANLRTSQLFKVEPPPRNPNLHKPSPPNPGFPKSQPLGSQAPRVSAKRV